MSKEFKIYANGLCCCSACSSLPVQEVTERVNRENPTNIDSKWILTEKNFRTGEPNPCPCDQHPETHKHYLFSC